VGKKISLFHSTTCYQRGLRGVHGSAVYFSLSFLAAGKDIWYSLCTRTCTTHAFLSGFVLVVVVGFIVFCTGIDDLKLSSAQELIGQGHTMSSKFKTAATFGFQPVTMSNISLELFQTYVDMLRPMVSQGRCNDPKHALWLNWKGEKDTSIGRKVQRFYIRTLGLDVTTTRIRSLMETVANDLHESGDITLGAKQALGGTSGHSDATIKAYYLMKDMQKNVHQGRQVFEVFS